MKGLSTSLIVVITAIVVLVVALVLLTIFGTGIQKFNSLGEAQNFCFSVGVPSCQASGQLPISWARDLHETPSGKMTCADLAGANCNDVLARAGK